VHGTVLNQTAGQEINCHYELEPWNMYIGENFNVRFHDIFRFWKLLENNSSCGILHSEFIPNKNFRNMMISRSAQKIRDVPNAGGNSVISEVLSFEFLNKAVQAQLLKVGVIRCHSSLFFLNKGLYLSFEFLNKAVQAQLLKVQNVGVIQV
jgi:hypothetical protein